jgi:phage gpG-like protein
VVVVRARRYLHEFPVGKYYQDALASMLDAYFNMELYDSALEVAKRLYMDDLMKRNSNGKPGKYWIETVARIGECYAKTGNLEKANTILRDNAKAILASEDPYNAFRIWAGLAAERGQYFEAMRRLDIAHPYVKSRRNSPSPGGTLSLQL